MSCQHEGHHFVAELAVVHAFARILVTRLNQAVEDVPCPVAGAAAGGEYSVDDAVQPLPGALELAVVGGGKPGIEGHQGARFERLQVGDFRNLTNFIGITLDVASEQGGSDDPERELAHLPVEPDAVVARPPIPLVQHGRRQRVDRPVEALDRPVAEGRLDESPLPDPVGPVVRDEAVAHDLREHAVAERLLGKMLVALREDRTQELGVVHEIDVSQTAPKHEIAVLAQQFVHPDVRRPLVFEEPVKEPAKPPRRRRALAAAGGHGPDQPPGASGRWWNPGERRERQFSRWGGGARLTRRVREEPPPGELARVYFDRNATQNGAKRSGSAGMHRRASPHRENWAAWVSPPAAGVQGIVGVGK